MKWSKRIPQVESEFKASSEWLNTVNYDIHDNAAQSKFPSTITATANSFCQEFKKAIL